MAGLFKDPSKRIAREMRRQMEREEAERKRVAEERKAEEAFNRKVEGERADLEKAQQDAMERDAYAKDNEKIDILKAEDLGATNEDKVKGSSQSNMATEIRDDNPLLEAIRKKKK